MNDINYTHLTEILLSEPERIIDNRIKLIGDNLYTKSFINSILEYNEKVETNYNLFELCIFRQML